MSDSASRAGDLACPGCPSRCGGRPGRGCGGRGPPDGGSRRVAGAPGGRGTAVPLREVPEQVWDDVLEQERADVPAVVAALLALRDVLSRSRRRCRRDTGTRIVVGQTSQDSVHQGGSDSPALHDRLVRPGGAIRWPAVPAGGRGGPTGARPRFVPARCPRPRRRDRVRPCRALILRKPPEMAGSIRDLARRCETGETSRELPQRRARSAWVILPRSSAAERTRWVTRRAPARGVQGGCDLAVAAAGGRI